MADKSVFRSKGPVTMDVWGVCASRDIFGFHRDFHEDDARFILGKNFMACSFMSQFSRRNGPELTSEDLDLLKTEFRTMTAGVAIRSALADFNKTIPDQLRESGSEWLIIDGRTDSYGLTEIEYENGTCDYVSSKASFRYGIDEILIEYSDQVEAVQVWGLTDNMSWRTGQYPLLFDSNRNPKPAFYGVLEAVEE